MEFWGVEVKAGEPLVVKPTGDRIIHLSQASLGEFKTKGNEQIPVFVKVDGQKLVLGTLSTENYPQISFDLVFEKDFELSHNWKSGSIYFCGYKSDFPSASEDEEDDFTDSEEEFPVAIENGKAEQKKEEAKPATAKANASAKPESSSKPKVKVVEPKKDDDDDSDEDDDSDDDSLDDDSDDEDMLAADNDDSEGSDEDDDEDDSADEETPTPKKKVEGKKRGAESATKTPVPSKKAKINTPQKTDGKKGGGGGGGGHTATPHPSKQVAKTPAPNSDKKQKGTPGSGSISCKSCTKKFNSDGALESHTKAKHAGK